MYKRQLKKVDTISLPQIYKGWYFYVLGDAYRYNNQEEKAFPLKLKSQQLFDLEGNKKMANAVNYDLHYTLVSQDFLNYDGASYLNTFLKNAKKNNNNEQLLTAYLGLSFLGNPSKNINNTLSNLQKATQYTNLSLIHI